MKGIGGISSVWIRIVAVASCAWAVAVFDKAGDSREVSSFSESIQRGERFRGDVVRALADRVVPRAAQTCNSQDLIAPLVIAAFAVELEMRESQTEALDRRLAGLSALTGRVLACSPTSSFAWLMRYWTETVRTGFNSDAIALLSMSYSTGPKETWIAARRNTVALDVFDFLPEAIQSRAVQEWADIVRTGQIDLAANTLARQPVARRLLFLKASEAVPNDLRNALQLHLDRLGAEITVPGATQARQREWFR